MNATTKLATVAAVLLSLGTLRAADETAPMKGTPAQLLTVLPECCNTPDGMTLLPDNSIILSVPNFNDTKASPLLMKITPENKAEVFHAFPTPYPGLPAPVNRITPMGICLAPSGDIYLADNQYMTDKDQKSRLWRLSLKDGKVSEMALVASGFNVANGIAIRGQCLYITESVLVEGFNPTLKSAVMRFRIDENNVKLATPLADDPHIIATYESRKKDWGFGADGIAFDSKGNLFVGVFGDAELYKIEFDAAGNVKSNKLFAKADCMRSCDGMSCDLRTDKLYLADSAANAVQVISPNGTIAVLSQNPELKDKRQGGLDQPCEALVRGNTIVVSNMDWPFPGFVNSKWQMPATLSVIPIDEPEAKR